LARLTQARSFGKVFYQPLTLEIGAQGRLNKGRDNEVSTLHITRLLKVVPLPQGV